MDRSAQTVENLFAAHRGELVAFVERRMGSRAIAEDLVQQAAVRALVGAEALRDARAGRAWLFTITRRLLSDYARARTEVPLVDEHAAEVEADELGCACVLENLEHLKPDFAHVLRRVVFDGAALADVAAELGLTTNAATVRLSRARTALRGQ